MFVERSISGDGLSLHAAFAPEAGPPLVFLHGVGRRGVDWMPLVAGLMPWGQAILVDHRGHGKSERAPRYLVADYIADAVVFLRSLPEQAIVIGHSLGALTALGAASQVPECVRAAVLLDPPSPTFLARVPGTSYADMWEGMRRHAGSALPCPALARKLADLELTTATPGVTQRLGDLRDAAALRFMARCLKDLDPRTLDAPLACTWLDGFDMLAAARAVRCPTCVLAGDPTVGGMLHDADRHALLHALADAVHVQLAGVGHLVHWQDMPAVLRAVHGFLGGA